MKLSQTKVHFIGIGGIGMSGIAELLLNLGAQVSGSDLNKNAQTERLVNLGAKIFYEHDAENVRSPIDVVVYSSAVKGDNPELVLARELKIPVIPRAEMLAELMRLKRGVAIAGSHGKTTTTSMIAAMMISARLDPTIVVGGRLDLIKSTAALGKGEWLVAEADESDGSFLKLSPEHVVITNIDNDHLDHYKDFASLEKAFLEFANRVPFYGSAVLCADDPHIAKLTSVYSKAYLTYGMSKSAELSARDIHYEDGIQRFEVFLRGKKLGNVDLKVAGRHNVLNALAAVGLGLQLKMPFESIATGLAQYSGVDRRLQLKGTIKDVPIYDDYGHHPTDIKATVSAVRQMFPDKKLAVVFQPHRFSRTQLCWDDFTSCFAGVDSLVLLDVYAASEHPIEGVDSEKLADAIRKKGMRASGGMQVSYQPKRADALKWVHKNLNEVGIVLTMGAGDISKLADEILGKSGSNR